MELIDFLRDTQAEIRSQLSEGAPFSEMVFTEVVMQHLAEIGMTSEPNVCHFTGKVGVANLRLSGFAFTDEKDELDLFVSLYEGVDEITAISETDTKGAVQQCLRFLTFCAEGKMSSKLDPSTDVYTLSLMIHQSYNSLEQIRIFVLTDRVAKSKSFKPLEMGGKSIRLEVMDIERLHRHWSEGKPRDELIVNFEEVSGQPLPCVFVPGDKGQYDYALTAVPGEALRLIYEKYGTRLLEANVRSFLSVKGKGVNAGIQNTLRSSPENFMAYNNGIVLVADEMKISEASDGSPGIHWLRGMQIVNGGQTTASLYFAKKRFPDTDLSAVRVPAKIIVLKEQDPALEEALVSDISRYANSQNAVKQSDLSANKPFHVDVERLSLAVFCPDGVGRWFYERAAGSYNTLLAREGIHTAKGRKLKESIPTSRKITKTDLAKYLMAWDGEINVVSLGSQKCFDKFMERLAKLEAEASYVSPSVQDYKLMVAKAILFKAVQKLFRPMFQAYQANVVAYTIGMVSERHGSDINLIRIWDTQSLSDEFLAQWGIWGREVNSVLHKTASGRMISEWAKRPECRTEVLQRTYSVPKEGIPEFKK